MWNSWYYTNDVLIPNVVVRFAYFFIDYVAIYVIGESILEGGEVMFT